MLRKIALLLLLVGCHHEETRRKSHGTGTTSSPPGLCGDGAVDPGEACDDGNPWFGDGCDPSCAEETGPLEHEPNDAPPDAQSFEEGVNGALIPGDTDCYALAVPEGGAVRATITGEACGDAAIELWSPDGLRAAVGLPSFDGCPVLDPEADVWARYLPAGDYAVCLTGIQGAVVPGYQLSIEVLDSCTAFPAVPFDTGLDLEGDGIADTCDDDDDGDGVPDATDNCPTVPNGPTHPFAWDTSDDGFVRQWMVLGPFTTGVSPGSCEPSPDDFTGGADADAAPSVGDDVGGIPWIPTFSWPGASATVSFTTWFADAAPREAYAFTWVQSAAQRDVVVAMGSDDGHAVWVNGVEVGRDAGCHGVGVDAFRYPVTLQAGWNRLLVKVYDGGGGWGMVVRFYESDEATLATDLATSLEPAPWADNQGDLDGDGIGDLCDPDPAR